MKTKNKTPYSGLEGALQLICDIGLGYDGMGGSVESMKVLVDELVGIARAGIELGDNYDGLKEGYCKKK